MAKKLQILRGTTAQNDAYTGSIGELTMDTEKVEVRIHDGTTQGGKTIGADLVSAGVVVPFAGTTAPTGWLKCDGSAISRTTYAALFAVIGTTYGTGDGSTTFNLPTQSVLPLGTSANVSVFGTGKALGINDGSSNGGMSTKKSDNLGWSMLVLNTNNYNQNIGYAGATTSNSTKTAVGVVTDASKSGLKGTVNLANATGAKAIVCIKY